MPTEQEKTRMLEAVDRLTKKFEAAGGNERAMAAHRPIYDQAFAEMLKSVHQPLAD